jgi:NADPH-dependent glutamate synthase beta subunit-like oxidoreductase
VFEQNVRPFGKIEDGLPRWHVAQREKEYQDIAGKLAREGIHVAPKTKVGRDVEFVSLARDWGFNAVVLACGAWRDRRLTVPSAERFEGKGLIYQNPLIYWFNHAHESHYDGPVVDIPDDAIIIGGGLASIDVAKICMLETTRRALAERDIDVSIIELERQGIPKTLAAHGLNFGELGLRGCTLFYRRRIQDMSILELPDDADEARRAKIEASRSRMIEKAQDKYLFRVEPLAQPEAVLSEGDRMIGLRFRRTAVTEGKQVATEETFDRFSDLTISSIGSVPEPIEGIAMKGELFDFIDWNLGKLADFPSVFGAGNAVTGKGNIVASRKHAVEIAEHMIEGYLGLGDGLEQHAEVIPDEVARAVSKSAAEIVEHLLTQDPISPDALNNILGRIAARQSELGYTDLDAWLTAHPPPA